MRIVYGNGYIREEYVQVVVRLYDVNKNIVDIYIFTKQFTIDI
jgi:hypothetical protein